jgi:hypothetical protein
MIQGLTAAAVIVMLSAFMPPPAGAEVRWRELKSMNLDSAPEDICLSADGTTIYVLTRSKAVLVLNADGSRRDGFTLDEPADRIAVSPRGDALILTNRETGKLRIIGLEFVHQINAGDSPFRGPQDAPVVVTVFSDFQ